MKDLEKKHDCHCEDGCSCNEECNPENECSCGNECECNKECNPENECSCDEECDCDGNCECENCECSNDLEKKIQELENQIKELNDKALREKAESINYRKRKDEELNKMLKYANEGIIKELLPVVDNFERAIKLDDDNLEDELSKFLSGFKMIYCNLISILEKTDVKQIDGNNKPFDPTYHQAVITEKIDGMEKDMIIEVLQKGYLYKDKVIRPAMVKVSE